MVKSYVLHLKSSLNVCDGFSVETGSSKSLLGVVKSANCVKQRGLFNGKRERGHRHKRYSQRQSSKKSEGEKDLGFQPQMGDGEVKMALQDRRHPLTVTSIAEGSAHH